MPILARHIWEKVDDPQRYQEANAFIGTGPYRFVDFDSTKGTYLFEVNKDYYLGKPAVDRVIYIKAKNPLMALLSHKADLVNIKPDMAAHLKKKDMVVLESPRGWNKKLMINHKKPPLNDKRFRKALAYAINQQEIIDKAHRGFAHSCFSRVACPLITPFTIRRHPAILTILKKPKKFLRRWGIKKMKKGLWKRTAPL